MKKKEKRRTRKEEEREKKRRRSLGQGQGGGRPPSAQQRHRCASSLSTPAAAARRAKEEKKRNKKNRGSRLCTANKKKPVARHRASSSAVATTTASSTASTPPQVNLLCNLCCPCHASIFHVACEQLRTLFTRAGLSPCCWAGSAQPISKKYIYIFQYLWFPHVLIYVFFCLISVFILHRKNKNLVLKYMVFVNFWKVQKKILKKKEKCFLCIQPSISKLKNHSVFHTPKKSYFFSMHFGFNKQFIKVMRTLAKISKTTKFFILFVF